MTRLLGSMTAVIILIAAVVVFVQTRRQPNTPSSVRAVNLLLVVAAGGLLWYMWFGPASSPPIPAISQEEAEARFRESQMALPTDTPEVIVKKMGCFVCHKIPTIPNATVGTNGPVLMLRTTASQRLASPEYQARVKAGLAHAATPREYVIESIINPSAFIVPGYDKTENAGVIPMYPDYQERFTPEALEFLALFLLQLDEQMARDEGLLGAPASPTTSQTSHP